MQDASALPHTAGEFLRYLIAAILGVGATLLTSLLRRKQSAAEIKKTEAETRHLELTNTFDAGHVMVDLLKLSAQSALDVERLRREKDFWQAKAESLETEKALLERQLDERIRIGKGD